LKKTDRNNKPGLRLIAIAAAAVAISACGGGGDSGGGLPLMPTSDSAPQAAPTTEPVQPTPALDSSAPCFNEADFREGTVVDIHAVKTETSPASSSFRRLSVTGGREAFAGANPIAFSVESVKVKLPQSQQTTIHKEHKDLVDGNVLLYGKSKTTKHTLDPKLAPLLAPGTEMETVVYDSQVFSPPFAFPVDMKAGQVVSQGSSITKTTIVNGRGNPSTSLPATGELTYHGREQLETPLGTFNTCKFTSKITIGASMITKNSTNVFWVASDGPYRGQMLKGTDPKAPMLVTQMTYSPK
jgi:hypothetical protein